MSISTVTNLSGLYAANDLGKRAKQVAPNVSANTEDGAGSTVVTLSNGQTANVDSNSAIVSSTPLAVAWAPQLFSEADVDGDGKLTSSEFADQLKRVGVSAAEAQKMFSSFDTSKDGTVSLAEFVQGVQVNISSGSTIYSQLAGSYISGQGGGNDAQSINQFLANGASEAEKYWSMRP
jgi:hypothetical protein